MSHHAIEVTLHKPQSGPILTPAIVDAEKSIYSRSLLRKAFLNVINGSATIVVGRRTEIIMIMSALLSNNNVMLFGNPGEGKSYMADTIMKFFRREGESEYGANIFSTQFFQEMSVEPILGAVPIDTMMQGGTARILEGRLPMANLAVLDELGKAPSSVLSALMSILNEGKFYNGDSYVDVPLVSAIAATNEDDFDVAGLASRFLLKMHIGRLGTSDRIEVMSRRAAAHKAYYPVQDEFRVDMRQLYWAQMSVCKVEVENETLVHMAGFADFAEQNGIVIDTRQMANAIDFLKAYTWLTTGVKSVSPDKLKVIPYIFCALPSDFAAIKDFWNRYASSVALDRVATINPDEALLEGLLA